MRVEKVVAVSLGVVEKEGGVDKNGNSYAGYTMLGYAIAGENVSRKCYPKDDKLKAEIRTNATRWGAKILISGEINAQGFLDVTEVQAGGGSNAS